MGDSNQETVALVPHDVEENGGIEQTSRFRLFSEALSKVKENATQTFSTAKPLSEVFDMTAFSKPQNMNEIVSRLRNNVSYFKTNYAIVAMGTTALLMLMNPSSLIVLGLLALVWFYMYIIKTSALVLGGREFSEREKFWLLSGGSVFVIFFLTSVGATIFYALGLSMIMIAAHGSLRIPDDTTLFADEVPTESSSLTGLLSMFRPKTTLSEFTSSV